MSSPVVIPAIDTARAAEFRALVDAKAKPPPSMPSASKIGPNSAIDWLARVTICLATGDRSEL